MSLNARFSQSDPRLYNVNRDLGHNFDQLITEVAERCSGGASWQELTQLAKEHNVSDEDLGRACETLCIFVLSQVDRRGESMAGCLARSGFFEVNPWARIIVMAHLGSVVLGVHWVGVHEVTLGGAGPLSTDSYQALRACGAHCANLMRMSRWQRTFYKLRARARTIWAAVRGDVKSDKDSSSSGQERPSTPSA